MASLNKRQHDYFYAILANRDGEYCRLCGKTLDEAGILEIHETQYTKTPDSANMLFLCHGCNHLPTLRKQQIISQRDHTPEHQKNLEAEPYFEDWLYNELSENNWHLPLSVAIDSGAYNCGVSVITIKRYLSKLTSKDAPYSTHVARFGEMHLWLKSKMPIDELKYW